MIREITQAEPEEQSGGTTPKSNRRRIEFLRPLGGVVVALLLWEVISIAGIVNKSALPTPIATSGAIVKHAGGLGSAVLGTLEAWALGLFIAAIAGIAIGTMVGRSRIADAASETLVRMMRPLPSLALIPIAILVAGLGLKMTSGLVSFAAFWPIFINTRAGVHQVDNRFLESASALGLRRFELIRRVVIPASLPMIASGIQVAISLALVVTVSVELVGGTGGLGEFVLAAQQGNATSSMFAGVIVGGSLGWALNAIYLGLVDRVMPWRTQGDRN